MAKISKTKTPKRRKTAPLAVRSSPSRSLHIQRVSDTEILPANQYKSLALRSMFWRPDYLQGGSAWVEHLPFAFWIVEALQPSLFVELGTHYGHSYFSFCQAIKRLGINTPSYAVDTWKGDDQAGHYDESVYQQLESYNQANYPEFSSLLRCTFDEAVTRFNDGSIDLLHIDGFHTYEAVRHDFESWLPKLSERAVVLFHDTNVRRDNFGVHKYFAELKEKYPFFEFIHGHGLGVLGVGKNQGELLTALYNCYAHQPSRNIVYELFSRLGRSCHDLMDLNQAKDNSRVQENRASVYEKIANDRTSEIELLNGELRRASDEIQATSAQITHLEAVSDERGSEIERLNEKIRRLNDESTAKQSQIEHVERVSDERGSEIERLNEEIRRLNDESTAKQSQIEHVERVSDERGSEIERLNRENKEKSKKLENYISEAARSAQLVYSLIKEKENVYNGSNEDYVKSIELLDSCEKWPHKHINFELRDIYINKKEIKLLKVRIVNHFGYPGICILDYNKSTDRLFKDWFESGRDNGVSYMLLVPRDKKSKDWIVQSIGSDYNLINVILQALKTKLKSRINQIQVNGNVSDVILGWLKTCIAIEDEIKNLEDRLHYDDVITSHAIKGNQNIINFQITNVIVGSRFIPKIEFNWYAGKSKGTFEFILSRNEKTLITSWPRNEDGKRCENLIYIPNDKNKKSENYKLQLLLTESDKRLLNLICKEVQNLTYHSKNNTD